jgi:hypothetical protein
MSALRSDDHAVVLTDRGRDLLETNRPEQERSWEARQTFYAGLRKPRELMHDSNVYRAYLRAEKTPARAGRPSQSRGAGLTSSSATTSGSYTSVIADERTATERRIGSPTKSHDGLANTTCRTRTVMSTSLMPGSSTKTVTGGHVTKTSRS